jgi:hypothetical protein
MAPSTAWRWMWLVVKQAKRTLQTLQRRLVEARTALLHFALPMEKCVNAAKARLIEMRSGLDNAAAIYQLAQQFLHPEEMKKALFSVDMLQRYPPQSSHYELF